MSLQLYGIRYAGYFTVLLFLALQQLVCLHLRHMVGGAETRRSRLLKP